MKTSKLWCTLCLLAGAAAFAAQAGSVQNDNGAKQGIILQKNGPQNPGASRGIILQNNGAKNPGADKAIILQNSAGSARSQTPQRPSQQAAPPR